MRPILLLLLLGSCGISTDEQTTLNRYQANAAVYYEGGNLDQAMTQITRGLEIDADDYKLTNIKGWILLRRSSDDPSQLDEARAAFEKLMAMRSPRKQHRGALLGYGSVLQGLGMRDRSKAEQLRRSAERLGDANPQADVLKSRANEHMDLARSHLQSARTVLHYLLDKGELVLAANFHLMQVSALVEDYPAAVQYGEACLIEVARAQESAEANLQDTPSLEYEKNQHQVLWGMRSKEIEVRGYLADLHYNQGQFAESVRHLDVILRMDPQRSADYYNRGRCLRKLGRVAAAKADFQTFLAISPLPAGNPMKVDAAKAIEAN